MSPHKDDFEQTPTDAPMSDREMARKVREMHRALIGNPLDKDDPGAIAILRELHMDYYGDEKTKRIGTKEMVLQIWNMRLKILGAATALGATGGFLWWIVQAYVIKIKP